jgi:glucokinase
VAVILAGDIGGTNTRLALAEPGGKALTRIRRYENAGAAGLDVLVADYLAELAVLPDSACFAIAGPVTGPQARLTNLSWLIDADAMARRFGCPTRLVNDFEAVGHGLGALDAASLHSLQIGKPLSNGPRLALGAGTGLGVVQCLADDLGGYRPMASEGGHIAFAPLDAQQTALWHTLQAEYGRVSVERILSGPGIVALYRHCRLAMGKPLHQSRSAAEITGAALAGSDATALWALQLFCAIYGQTAGDLALVTRAQGGVYLAGGIAAKILPLLEDGRFLAGFCAKGRFSDWMTEVPVHVVLDPDVGLRGTAIAAGRD